MTVFNPIHPYGPYLVFTSTGITSVSNSADRNPWFEREFKRGYDDAKRQYDSPYQRGYRRAMEEIERKEMIRKSIENPNYFL